MKRVCYATLPIIFFLSLNAIAQTKQDLSNAPTIDYCALIREPASYDQQLVRVRAFYIVGFEGSLFNKQDCHGKDVWVKFDPSFEKLTKSKVLKKFNSLADASPVKIPNGGIDYPIRMVEVVVVGCLERVTPTYKVGA